MRKQRLEEIIKTYRVEHEKNLGRYCDGMARASYLVMTAAKEYFARSKEELANAFRNAALDIDQNIQMTADNQHNEMDKWERETRAAAKPKKK